MSLVRSVHLQRRRGTSLIVWGDASAHANAVQRCVSSPTTRQSTRRMRLRVRVFMCVACGRCSRIGVGVIQLFLRIAIAVRVQARVRSRTRHLCYGFFVGRTPSFISFERGRICIRKKVHARTRSLCSSWIRCFVFDVFSNRSFPILSRAVCTPNAQQRVHACAGSRTERSISFTVVF